MKKELLTIALCAIMTTQYSCSDSTMLQSEEGAVENTVTTVNLETDATLKFESQAEFDNALQILRSLKSEKEKSEWVHTTFPKFTSIQDVYEQAGEEMADMTDESEAAFMSFKNKYKELYFPLVGEDAGFYIPIKDLDVAYLANPNGKVIINNAEIDLKDISDYETLKTLGRAYYELPKTRAVETEFQLNSTSMNSVGPEYDSGWKEYGKRKIKLKARRKFTTIELSPGFNGSQSWFHTEFCFRKKTIVGWVNYRCTSNITGTVTIPGFPYNLKLDATETGTSSHDKDYPYPIHISSSNGNWYYRFYEAPCTATVAFKDIDQLIVFNWNMPGIYATSAGDRLPVQILPSNR